MDSVGLLVGEFDGAFVGLRVGEGVMVGLSLGTVVDGSVGCNDGAAVVGRIGEMVGAPLRLFVIGAEEAFN